MRYDENLPEYLTFMGVSRLLKVHPSLLRNWDRDGALKSVRIGVRKLRRYTHKDIEKFIEESNKETK